MKDRYKERVANINALTDWIRTDRIPNADLETASNAIVFAAKKLESYSQDALNQGRNLDQVTIQKLKGDSTR